MRLVDADALMESLKESADRAKKWYEDCKDYNSAMIDRAEQTVMTFNECGLRIKEAPTVDAVPVRCKDCKHRDPEDRKCDCGHDIMWQLPRGDDWYCADGERKDGGNHE